MVRDKHDEGIKENVFYWHPGGGGGGGGGGRRGYSGFQVTLIIKGFFEVGKFWLVFFG